MKYGPKTCRICAALTPLVVVLAVLAARVVHANEPDAMPTKEEQRIADIFSPMIAAEVDAGRVKYYDTMVDPTPTPGESPMSMGICSKRELCKERTGYCALVIGIRDNFAYPTMMALPVPTSATIKIRTVLAHELGHCQHDIRFPEIRPHTHGAELYADLYALAWTARHYPKEYDAAADYIYTMRLHFTRGVGNFYPTAAEINKARGMLVVPESDDPALDAMRVFVTFKEVK